MKDCKAPKLCLYTSLFYIEKLVKKKNSMIIDTMFAECNEKYQQILIVRKNVNENEISP
jgi:hypothetical protein